VKIRFSLLTTGSFNREAYNIRLNADLNKGAGGQYIYFLFTRDANTVQEGIEYQKVGNYTDAQSVAGFLTANGSNFGQPSTPTYYWPIWNANNNPNIYWNPVDLNAGAGGKYIYSYQSKDYSTFDNGVVNYHPGFTEIGVLSGNSDTIMPPTGWIKYPADLNEGAGGDYIYFCYRIN
jgi:hypothetical protein